MGVGDRLRRWDLYKKIPEDLTVSTVPGGYLSICGMMVMVLLFVLELNSYLTVQYQTTIVMDENQDETMRIHFNITIPDLRCELATIDVSDTTGLHRHNLTQNIVKLRQDHKGRVIGLAESKQVAPQYEMLDFESEDEVLISEQLGEANFDSFLKQHHLVMVDFYAPWCIWCQRLAPVWEKTAKTLPSLHFGQRVRLGEVNCVAEAALCQKLHIRAYPSILYFKDGSPNPVHAYMGDRTVDAFLQKTKDIIEGEVDPAEQAKAHLHELDKQEAQQKGVQVKDAPGPEGCRIVGAIAVKRIPGNFHIHLSNPGFSVHTALVNASHHIEELWFGSRLTPYQERQLPSSFFRRNLIEGKNYYAKRENHTYVHYLNVITNTYVTTGSEKLSVYTYTAHSNEYIEENDDPSVMFRYQISPMSVETRPVHVPFYHFVTNVCAIIGGVFTVIGLLDSVIHQTARAINKKVM